MSEPLPWAGLLGAQCCPEPQLLGSLQGSRLLQGCISLSRVKQILLAQAEAEKIRKIGEAEAFVIEAVGMAEAEGLKLKAEALQKYGEAAQLALVLDALPEVRRGQLFPAPGGLGEFPDWAGSPGGTARPYRDLPGELLSSSLTFCSPCFPRLLPKCLLPSPKWMRSLFSMERKAAPCQM